MAGDDTKCLYVGKQAIRLVILSKQYNLAKSILRPYPV